MSTLLQNIKKHYIILQIIHNITEVLNLYYIFVNFIDFKNISYKIYNVKEVVFFENNKRNMYYRLTDPFCLFYIDQVEGRNREPHFWQDNEHLPQLHTWRGRAFENACLYHIEQIKGALGIKGVSSENDSWTMQGTEEQKGMQIDLIINRSDRVVNLCEMKFVNTEFEVKNDYERALRNRLNWMIGHVSRRHNVQMTLITTYGLKYGIHSGIFQRVVTLDSLFES